MERALTREGYRVFIATNGREGLNMLFQERPHCIVLDVVLPEMNGYEVCRHIRNSKMSSLPIIMVSTKNTALDKSWAIRQGATHYLVKPFNPEDLAGLVKQTLAQQPSPAPELPPLPPIPPTIQQHSPVAARPVSTLHTRNTGPDIPVLDPLQVSGKMPTFEPAGNKDRKDKIPGYIPQRPEGADLLWGRSPHFLFSADQPTRTLYEAIDGKRPIKALCELTRMSQEEVVKILRSLLIQHRIQICDTNGKVLHSAVLFTERL
jgi:CheY-like chemotaxis protein